MCREHLSIRQLWNFFCASNRKACLFVILETDVVSRWTDASVVANKVFADTRSTVFFTTIIDVSTEFLSLHQLLFKAVSAIAAVCVDAFSNCVNARSAWSASMLLASIYISALHIWCRVAKLTIGETFRKERGRGIVFSTGSVPFLTGISRSFLKGEMLTDSTINRRMIEVGHFSTSHSFTFVFVIFLELPIG
jgi:hypothetical protein